MAALLIVVYLFMQAGDGGGDDEQGHGNNTVATEPQVTTTLATEPTEAVAPVCPAEDGSSPRTLRFTEEPQLCIDIEATYVATVKTNRGDFEITLDPQSAQRAVNSFIFLARYHYYDGVAFTRVLRNYVAQTADPVRGDRSGGGDAGYLLPEEPPKQAPFYAENDVVLANQPPKPNSTGSEIMIFTGSGPQVDQLAPSVSRIGRITAGQNVIDAIDATGRKNDAIGAPDSTTVIETVTIRTQ